MHSSEKPHSGQSIDKLDGELSTEHGTPSADTAQLFRDVFRHHPSGVTLVTATVDDEPVGVTLSSLTSLSLAPLSVSFSLMKRTGSAGKLLRADSYVIHFLTDEQADIAYRFAQASEHKFRDSDGWVMLPTGEPFLYGSRATMRARTLDTARAGESTLIAAEILSVTAGENEPALLFQNHKFYSIDGIEPLGD